MNLYIDTHLNDIILILFKNGEIIREKRIIGEKNNSTLIMPALAEIVDVKEVNSILVCNGPGSFTGVRLGVTIAKTLAYTLNIPIRTINYLECMRLSTENNIVAFSDGNGYYVGEYIENTPKLLYLSNVEFKEYNLLNNVELNTNINYNKVFIKALEYLPVNPHKVNPIYIKKLAVEK